MTTEAAATPKPKKKLSVALARQRAKAERDGAWLDYEHGGRFFVHYHRHTDFLARRELLAAEERAALGLADGDELPPDAANRIGARAMFGTLVSKWEEVEDAWSEDAFTELLLADHVLALSIEHFSLRRENFWSAALGGLVRD